MRPPEDCNIQYQEGESSSGWLFSLFSRHVYDVETSLERQQYKYGQSHLILSYWLKVAWLAGISRSSPNNIFGIRSIDNCGYKMVGKSENTTNISVTATWIPYQKSCENSVPLISTVICIVVYTVQILPTAIWKKKSAFHFLGFRYIVIWKKPSNNWLVSLQSYIFNAWLDSQMDGCNCKNCVDVSYLSDPY